jgi:fumarate reductase subunit D
MTQNNQRGRRGNAQPTDNNHLHYKTLVHLFSLGSQEFYNRFTAMVLSHTILLSGLIIGFDLFKNPNLDKCVKMVAAVIVLVGVALCAIWCLLLRQSLAAQHFYRHEAKKLERNLTFKIFSCREWQKLSKGCYSIKCLSAATISLFFIIYIVLLLYIIV